MAINNAAETNTQAVVIHSLKKFRRDDLSPMSAQKLLPCRFPLSFACGLDAYNLKGDLTQMTYPGFDNLIWPTLML